MEAAVAVTSLVAVLILCIAGLTAVATQVRCLDSAREVARLAARGDGAAGGEARGIAPAGAAVEVRRDGGFIVARVSVRSPVLPGIVIVWEAVSAVESGQR